MIHILVFILMLLANSGIQLVRILIIFAHEKGTECSPLSSYTLNPSDQDFPERLKIK